MKIGYDGKRAFQNKTGLGNYSRSLVTILSKRYPEDDFVLFAPKQTALMETASFHNMHVQTPQSTLYKKLPSLWRRNGMVGAIVEAGIQIFHGLSNELPRGIEKTTLKTVVTVHDLIFERFPATYHFDERYVHRWKIKHACKVSDLVIAISKQTRDDLVNYYAVDPDKISICYQSCNPIFEQVVPAKELERTRHKYQLPERYFLFVSSITPRKNLQAICQAMILLKDKMNIPLVIIGDGKKEKETVINLASEQGIKERLVFLNDLPQAREDAFINGTDFPAIYQQALSLVYPSIFEGFGLPILEALWSRLPVICSNTSSMPEVAGDAALYFEPADHAQLADHMYTISTDAALASEMKNSGHVQAQKFTQAKYAANMMDIYNRLK